MGKLTYLLRNERTLAKAHVIVDGTDVHASHPRGEHRLITFKTDNDKAALAKFQDVIKQHFHPRDGWVLEEKKPGLAVYPEFPKPPSEAEIAAAAAAQRQKSLGYVIEDKTMVLNLEKQRTVGDMEIALGHAAGILDLWALTKSDDGQSARALFLRLHEAAPKLRGLFLDCPWQTLTRSCATPLPGLPAYLDEHRTLERISVVGEVNLTKPLQQDALASLALCADPIDADTIGVALAQRKTPKLATLHLNMAVEGSADGDAVDALPSILNAPLETLTLEGLPNVEEMIAHVLAAKHVPSVVRLDGSCGDGDALVAAVNNWSDAAKGKLLLGSNVRDLLDDEASTQVEAKLGEEWFTSPFAPESQDPKVRELWSKLG